MKESEYLIIAGGMWGLFYSIGCIGGLELCKNYMTLNQFKKCTQVYIGSNGLVTESTFLKSMVGLAYVYVGIYNK